MSAREIDMHDIPVHQWWYKVDTGSDGHDNDAGSGHGTQCWWWWHWTVSVGCLKFRHTSAGFTFQGLLNNKSQEQHTWNGRAASPSPLRSDLAKGSPQGVMIMMVMITSHEQRMTHDE